MEESDDIIAEYPALALSIIVVVGATAYGSISLLIRGVVEPMETGLFAVVFAVVYLVFSKYSERIESYLGTE